ncbi:hypothetical protein [Egicoccus sp. AB-alg2]|uniref:hypothetical protein n=1 Tax=Egicoccus sp. AB-alg2 TaxID=3242693 RepID=UPI00359D443A
MSALRRSVLALAVVLGAVACSADAAEQDPVLAEIRSELAARSQAETALVERVEELEARLERVTSDRSTAQRLGDVDEQLSSLSDAVTALDERLASEAEARDAVAEEAAGASADLRRSLTDLQGRLDQLQGETDELRTLYGTLRDRVDRQQRE